MLEHRVCANRCRWGILMHARTRGSTLTTHLPANPTLSTHYSVQEIIQNADDAGASTVHFYLDSRQHGSQLLIYPSLGQFQGPSLLSYNHAMFQEKDWKSIRKMQQSVRLKIHLKLGNLGLGLTQSIT